MAETQKRDEELQAVYTRIYEEKLKAIESALLETYERFAKRQGIEIADAQMMASELEMDRFQWLAKNWVNHRVLDNDKAKELMKLYNFSLRANRLELLKATMQLNLQELACQEIDQTSDYITQEGLKEYRQQAGIMELTVPEPEQAQLIIERISNTSFKGVKWSDRIWGRQEGLQEIVNGIVDNVVLMGRSPLEGISELRKAFGIGAYEARRLAVTESARVQTELQKDNYRRNDFEEYIYLAEPTACAVCADLHDKVFKVSEMVPGVNACPMHPHCHCSTAPNAERERERLEEMLAARDNELDLMSKKRLFESDGLRFSTKKYAESNYNLWIQGNSKAYRDTVDMLERYLPVLGREELPSIAVVSQSKLPGFAGYDYKEDVLYVSNKLSSEQKVKQALLDDYFAAKDFKDILIHELTHYDHWSAAKRLQKSKPKVYNSIEGAKEVLDQPLESYVKRQISQNPSYLLQISRYAEEKYGEGKFNEVVAESIVSGIDTVLINLIKGVLKNDDFTN